MLLYFPNFYTLMKKVFSFVIIKRFLKTNYLLYSLDLYHFHCFSEGLLTINSGSCARRRALRTQNPHVNLASQVSLH